MRPAEIECQKFVSSEGAAHSWLRSFDLAGPSALGTTTPFEKTLLLSESQMVSPIVGVMLWLSVGVAQNLPARLEQLFRQGVEALKAGQLEKAEQSFLAVLSQGGKAAYVYNNLGIVYQERGEHLKAVPQFREAIRLDPAYGAPRALIGASLLAVGQVPEAARELERAVKMMPAEPLVRLQLARAYERGGNVPAMVDQYRALSEHSPSEPEYAYQLGRAYRKLSEWSYRRIMRRNPRSARIYQTVGQHYVLQGKVDLALRAFQQAAQADPSLPEIHLALAQIYFESGKQAEALREAEQELAIVPESRAAQSLRLKLGGAR